MSLALFDVDTGFCLPLEVGQAALSAFRAEALLADASAVGAALSGRLSAEISRALESAVAWRFKPPSTAQLSFAASLSRRLGVDVPADALRYRGVMQTFLATHAEQLPERAKAAPVTADPSE